MPLPTQPQSWPPRNAAPNLDEYDAWYIGDPDKLATLYGAKASAATPNSRPAQYRGGIVGAAARLWWGRPIDAGAERRDQLHLPIAADLARTSSDLLYAEPPTLTVPDDTANKATQDRLTEYVDDTFHDELATGAELGAALGGRFHVVTWDPSTTKPFLTTEGVDEAIPEFRWGRLQAVTFWRVLEQHGGVMIRHLERHELDEQGIGLVYHGLYEGTGNALGRPIPLTDQGATAGLATLVDETGALIAGRTPGLCVEYVRNLPAKAGRRDPHARDLGRSDYEGLVGLMDAADEAYSSLMRDIRHAKSRLIVPETMLQSNGLGKGATFNLDTEVYEGVNMPPTEDGKQEIMAQQFLIRAADHLTVVEDLTRRIVHDAGYSSQTVSDGVEGGTVTATEVKARERRSYQTRDRKIRSERPTVSRLAGKMLSIDAAVYGTPGLAEVPVTVSFSDAVQESPLALAQTAQALQVAQAASTETRVRIVHPDWTKPQVDEEVGRIMNEAPSALADPFSFQG